MHSILPPCILFFNSLPFLLFHRQGQGSLLKLLFDSCLFSLHTPGTEQRCTACTTSLSRRLLLQFHDDFSHKCTNTQTNHQLYKTQCDKTDTNLSPPTTSTPTSASHQHLYMLHTNCRWAVRCHISKDFFKVVRLSKRNDPKFSKEHVVAISSEMASTWHSLEV